MDQCICRTKSGWTLDALALDTSKAKRANINRFGGELLGRGAGVVVPHQRHRPGAGTGAISGGGELNRRFWMQNVGAALSGQPVAGRSRCRCEPEDSRQVLVLLDQCCRHRPGHANVRGNTASAISPTYLLQRGNQRNNVSAPCSRCWSSTTANSGARWHWPVPPSCCLPTIHKYDLRQFISSNAELLANKVTEHAGRTGEHLSHNKPEYLHAACGNGCRPDCRLHGADQDRLCQKLKAPPLGQKPFCSA